jgi:hypothetical protein
MKSAYNVLQLVSRALEDDATADERMTAQMALHEMFMPDTSDNMLAVDKRTTGMYPKFIVIRTDGKSQPAEKHGQCQYFVLDVTCDPFADAALQAYANVCAREFPLLARDITTIRMVRYGCPTCKCKGAAPRMGTTAMGESFQGCSFCVNDDSIGVTYDNNAPPLPEVPDASER